MTTSLRARTDHRAIADQRLSDLTVATAVAGLGTRALARLAVRGLAGDGVDRSTPIVLPSSVFGLPRTVPMGDMDIGTGSVILAGTTMFGRSRSDFLRPQEATR